MFCEYCKVGSYTELCYCEKLQDVCYLVRRCTTERRWKPLNSMFTCKLRKEDIQLKKNEYKVRFEHKGYLYIEIGERVVKKKNPYDYVPSIVEMIKIDNELYFKGFSPKQKQEKENNKENKVLE